MSYISDYLKTCEGTEAPNEYNVWCMLGSLSTFAGRRFWFPFGKFNFHTNLYVVLVGDPGMRKTSAMNPAKDIVRMSGVCPVAASQITKEALSAKMSSTYEGKLKKDPFIGQKFFTYGNKQYEYNQYAIFATELTQFIGVNPLGFLEFLTAVWDEPILEVETKNKGSDYVVGPYITMIACMTPDIVKGFLKMNILSSGFARRTAFVFASHRNIVHIPTFTPEQEQARDRCVEFGKRIQKRSGPFGWTDGLKDYYIDWNQKNEESILQRTPATRGWYQSKGEMLFKISMLVALSEEPDELILDIPHYRAAQHFCSLIEKTIDRVFEGCGPNPNANVANQMCRMLESLSTPISKKKLQAMFGDQATSWHELTDTIAHLCTIGKLCEVEIRSGATVLGILIATPNTMAKYSDVEKAAFLTTPSAPQQE